MILEQQRSAALDAELARHRKDLQQALVEDYRDSLYYG